MIIGFSLRCGEVVEEEANYLMLMPGFPQLYESLQ